MKKRIYRLLGMIMVCILLTACQDTRQQEEAGKLSETTDTASGADGSENGASDTNAADTGTSNQAADESIPAPAKYLTEDPWEKLKEDPYGNYRETGGEIACITDHAAVMDGSYNEAIYDGIEMYALAAGISYSYYCAENDTSQAYRAAMMDAIANQAKIVVCTGYNFDKPLGELQDAYPDISFLLIDGVPTDKDGAAVKISDNVHCVSFREEQAGYLAGYMAVAEGYRRLGFIGGEEIETVIRYGYGYLQGIDDAAKDMGLTDVSVDYWYAGTFEPSREIEERAAGWYENGTEIIFSCGGYMYQSVLKAADEKDGLLIGVDRDQSALSERFLTSAFKDLANAVVISLDDYYASDGKWSQEFAGKEARYGVEENCVGIPVLDTKWRFQHVTESDYYEVYKRVKSGEVKVDDKTGAQPKVSVAVRTY